MRFYSFILEADKILAILEISLSFYISFNILNLRDLCYDLQKKVQCNNSGQILREIIFPML